ncbi:MAG: DUF3800 domain-containing protein [Bacteroidetes bacterium]|nr:DUF3800 domain-containing protein [Bacteroidota bacterium]
MMVQKTKEYVIWCDESVQKGEFYSDFYGGMIVASGSLREVNERLCSVLTELGYGHEAKWQKVNQHTLPVYERFVQEVFALLREGKARMRIMFRQSAHVAQNLTPLQRDRSFHLLYYQFLKHSFGWPDATPEAHGAHVRIYFDKLPDKAEKNEMFKNHVYALQRLAMFQRSSIVIRPDDIAEVDSAHHTEMQAVDVILGAMAFRLNDRHKAIPEGARRRGKRTLAKEKLYKRIYAEIIKMYPRFNIGESTGHAHPGFSTKWLAPYRHWKFVPRDFTVDESRYK